MKFLYRYLRPFGKAMLLGLSIKCFGTLIELALPYILSHIVDEVVPHDGRLSMILVWGAAMVLCALLAMLANVKANRMASRVARDGAERIRHDLFHRTMTLSASQIDAFTVPSLEARITTDTYNVHAFIGQMQRQERVHDQRDENAPDQQQRGADAARVGAAPAAERPAVDLEEAVAMVLARRAAGERMKDAVRQVAADTGVGRNELYDAALRASG